MSESVKLVRFSDRHIQKTFEWICDPGLQRQFLMRGDPSWEAHVDYFNKTLADPKQVVYAIYLVDEHVGNCGFKNIIETIEAELWIYIGSPLVRSKGVGKTATELLLEKGFGYFGLSLIYLHVADFNIPALKMYQKLGFHETPFRGDATDWTDRACKIMRMELEEDK